MLSRSVGNKKIEIFLRFFFDFTDYLSQATDSLINPQKRKINFIEKPRKFDKGIFKVTKITKMYYLFLFYQ